MKLDMAKVEIVSTLIEDSLAAMVSIKEAHGSLELNKKDIDNEVKRTILVASLSSKSDLAEKILRKGKPMDLTIKLGELTANVQRKAEDGMIRYESIDLAVSNIIPALI